MDKQIGFSFHQKGSGANKMHQIHFRPGGELTTLPQTR